MHKRDGALGGEMTALSRVKTVIISSASSRVQDTQSTSMLDISSVACAILLTQFCSITTNQCAEHMRIKGSIHCHGYDGDVFPCVQK